MKKELIAYGITIFVIILLIIALVLQKETFCGTSMESLLPPHLSVHFYHTENMQLSISDVFSFVNILQNVLRNKIEFYSHFVQDNLSSLQAMGYNALIRIINTKTSHEISIPLAKTPGLLLDDLQDRRVQHALVQFYKNNM